MTDATPFPLNAWYAAAWSHEVRHELAPRTVCARDMVLYRRGDGNGKYLAFLGRISPEKGVDRAIEIAARAGIPLKIAAKVDKVDRAYYKRRIKPLLKQPGVEFIGEIGESEKGDFLGDAMALLFPIDWPEPFGLVTIEAMASGTPVIAYRRGSVPEVVEDGVTGFVVASLNEAVAAVHAAISLDRHAIRRRFEERFTVERMARDYVAIYHEVLDRGAAQPAVLSGTAVGQRDAA